MSNQWRVLRGVALFVYTPLVVVFGIVIVIRVTNGIAIAEFTRDPLGSTDLPFYTGALSNLGVVVWSFGAAVCLFSCGVIRRARADSTVAPFLLAAGLITLLLLLDDLFMVHEEVFPQRVGIAEELVYGSYAVILLWFVVRYPAIILRTEFLLLVLAFLRLGLSVVIDLVATVVELPGSYVFEDGGKLFGIVSWTAYFVLVSAREVTAAARPRLDSAS